MISVVLVAYGTPAEVAGALASLRAQRRPPDEVIVVDNGYADGLALPDLEALREVRVERPLINLGYGTGCNLGARLARGDELLLVNADVLLTQDACSTMSARLSTNAQTAVVGPKIFSGGRVQESARAFPSLRTGLLGRRSLLTRALSRAQRYPAELRHSHGSGGPVDWVSGACMLVRREAFEAVGGFDEDYWMYWEDADLCRRLRAAGWQVYYEPAAKVHHATGASGMSERTVRAFHESAARFADRHIARTPRERQMIRAILRLRAWFAMLGMTNASSLPEGMLRRRPVDP